MALEEAHLYHTEIPRVVAYANAFFAEFRQVCREDIVPDDVSELSAIARELFTSRRSLTSLNGLVAYFDALSTTNTPARVIPARERAFLLECMEDMVEMVFVKMPWTAELQADLACMVLNHIQTKRPVSNIFTAIVGDSLPTARELYEMTTKQ